MGNVISIKKVNKKFNDKKILDDIELNVKENEIFGLLGPSGAGKTTLIKIITGQLKATTGESKVFNINSVNLSFNELSNIGIVMDNCGIYSRLSCYENLKIFARIYKVDYKNIERVLTRVGLKEVSKRPAGKLSKGMKQRLIIARAILHNPKLLFLDEPTSGLDPSTAQGIHDLLLDFKAQGTTIFLTTHNMQEATKLCDNIGLLNEGKIVEYGKPKEICLRYIDDFNISVRLKNGQSILIDKNNNCFDKVLEYFNKNEIVSMHSNEPNLEDVFIKIAGRRFE